MDFSCGTGSRVQLVQRLCLFEAYWPPEELQSAPKLPKDMAVGVWVFFVDIFD
jgi:hypothetical protein